MSKINININKMQKYGAGIIKRMFGIAVGSVLLAVSLNALIIPYGLLSGGVGGLALIGTYAFEIPYYIGVFVLNIPIFIWGLKELEREFIIYSLVGTVVLIITQPLLKPYVPSPELDLFLASIFSGVTYGAGIGIVIKFGSSTGGSDILSIIMKKRKNISVGAFNFYFNIIVLALSLFFFELKIMLYTVISMWVAGKMMDVVIEGFNRHKNVTIISTQNQIIAERIINELKRGVTLLEGYGGFTKKQTDVINCVVNHYEIAKLKQIIIETDPHAFMFITETIEVAGEGFNQN
ncbi:YitT family protein [Peptococcaceae bacterium 1198_IL3148]